MEGADDPVWAQRRVDPSPHSTGWGGARLCLAIWAPDWMIDTFGNFCHVTEGLWETPKSSPSNVVFGAIYT